MSLHCPSSWCWPFVSCGQEGSLVIAVACLFACLFCSPCCALPCFGCLALLCLALLLCVGLVLSFVPLVGYQGPVHVVLSFRGKPGGVNPLCCLFGTGGAACFFNPPEDSCLWCEFEGCGYCYLCSFMERGTSLLVPTFEGPAIGGDVDVSNFHTHFWASYKRADAFIGMANPMLFGTGYPFLFWGLVSMTKMFDRRVGYSM